MDHKIRIKIGSIEIEYEGTEDYLKNDIPNLIDKIVALKVPGLQEEILPVDEIKVVKPETSNVPQSAQMSTNTIAAKLDVKSGPDIIIAACAHLYFFQRKDTFKRQEIHDEMKNASNFHKKSYSNNLTYYLKSLVGSKLIERSTGVYAFESNTVDNLKSTLNVS